MAIRGNRRLSGVSGGGTALMSLWGLLTATQAALSAENDANAVWRFFVNAPDAIPWAMAAAFLLLLAWTFMPRKGGDEQEIEPAGPVIAPKASGPQSSAVGVNTGTVYIQHGVQDATQPPKSPHGSAKPGYDIEKLTAGLTRALGGIPPTIATGAPRRCPPMPMWQAVKYVSGVVYDLDSENCFPKARQQIRQAAANGEIVIWGKRDIQPSTLSGRESCKGIWSEIPRDHWEDFEVNALATDRDYVDRDHTFNGHAPSGGRFNRYWSLMVDPAEIKAAWPEPTIPMLPTTPQVAKPDLPLNGLLVRIYGIRRREGGPAPESGSARAAFLRSVNLEIADTVKLNGLHVWGRLHDRPLEEISERDWNSGSVDHVRQVLVVPGMYAPSYEYTDLRFNKAEIERAWSIPPLG